MPWRLSTETARIKSSVGTCGTGQYLVLVPSLQTNKMRHERAVRAMMEL